MYVCMYICDHDKNMPSRLLPQWHKGFVATPALGQMMYDYTLLVPMKYQRVPKKLNKESNISGHKWSMTYRVLKSHRCKT